MIGNSALLLATAYKHTVTSTASLAASGINPLLDKSQSLAFGDWTRAVRPAMLDIGAAFAPAATDASITYYNEIRNTYPPTDGTQYTATDLIDATKAVQAFRDNIAYTFNTVQQTQNYDTVKTNVMATISDYVNRTSFNNMTLNAHHDKSYVTITYLPSGKCCNFCRALIASASTNHQHSLEYGGSDWVAAVFRRGSVFHPHCACTPVPEFTSMPSGLYNTPGQDAFSKDFHSVMAKAQADGVTYDNARDMVAAIRTYQRGS